MRSLANIVRKKQKNNWITEEILDLCDESRELRKKRFEPEESEKYKEVNNIKRCIKRRKKTGPENSAVRQENFRKNNSKRAHQFMKDLTTVKQGKATTIQDYSGKCITEEREILNQWTEK